MSKQAYTKPDTSKTGLPRGCRDNVEFTVLLCVTTIAFALFSGGFGLGVFFSGLLLTFVLWVVINLFRPKERPNAEEGSWPRPSHVSERDSRPAQSADSLGDASAMAKTGPEAAKAEGARNCTQREGGGPPEEAGPPAGMSGGGEVQGESPEGIRGLVGLASVKDEMERLTSAVRLMKMRERQGIPVSEMSFHAVFTGNPGTGKTTVARLLAGSYRELGVLRKGHLVETGRAGLVAEHAGQTAVKTNQVIDSALDGVLLINEAPLLAEGSGPEAIATLLHRMEEDRKRLVVVLSGREHEMKAFFNSNPALRSRFSRHIHFPDYNAAELLAIYKRHLGREGYALEEAAERHVAQMLFTAVARKDRHFGNAHLARSLFGQTLEARAMRLANLDPPSGGMPTAITLEDVLRLK